MRNIFHTTTKTPMDQDQTAQLLELEERLGKIRAQSTSKLPNQKHIAIILSAVEENINEQQSVVNPVNYFVSLMALLDQCITDGGHVLDLQLASSVVYLLEIIIKYVPKPLLRSKFAEILTKIAPAITTDQADAAPLIRSAVGCLTVLLIAQDYSSWTDSSLKVSPQRGLSGLLQMTLDARPKIRKKAQDSLHELLSNPPTSPSIEHVALPQVAQFALDALVDAKDSANIIHNLKLITVITSTQQWPTNHLESLCDLLMELSKKNEQYILTATFEVFENLFKSMSYDKCQDILETIFKLKPSLNDNNLCGAWIAVLVKGVNALAALEPSKTLTQLPSFLKVLGEYLGSQHEAVYISAAQGLIAVVNGVIQDDMLLYPPHVTEEVMENVDETVTAIAEFGASLLNIKYTHCGEQVLEFLTASLGKLRSRANPDFLPLLETVGEWRESQLMAPAERFISCAIAHLGPDVVLSVLPLNLVNQDAKHPGRAWILPLLRENVKYASLGFFQKEFWPLISLFNEKIAQLSAESMQLKVFETVLDQIWSLLPQFCFCPTDLSTAFTDEFASELSSILYAKVELRVVICHALKNLVESNIAYAQQEDAYLLQTFPLSQAQQNLEFLSTKASNMLSVLFNVFSQTVPDSRSFVLECLNAYLKVTKEEDLSKTFNNVCSLLKNAMDEEKQGKANKPAKGMTPLSVTLLDLVVAMTKYVPPSSYMALFAIFNQIISTQDAQVQKRAYRIVTKLSEIDTGSDALKSFIGDIERVLVENANTVMGASRATRLSALKTIVELLPQEHLSFVVAIVAEVILATKDVNVASRNLSFEILVSMANKMIEGGVITLEDGSQQEASLEEFFKIVSVGLIGESQHMVSATVTAYSCLVFEFKDKLDQSVLLDIYDTIELYLTSNSREIVKSAIGFSKVACLSLSDDLIKPKIGELLPKLLRWSHEHTGHFKAKVKHIVERLIRRFGMDFIEANFPEEDMKLLTNIKKTSKRNKNKDVTKPTVKSAKFMSALDEALADSDSEDEEPEENKGKKGKQFIVEGSNPLDLLDSQTLAHISSSRPKKHEQKKKRTDENFSFDAEGRLVVKNANRENPLEGIDSGINAYLDAVKQGPIRGQKGRLKYKKGNNNDDFSDDEADVPTKKVDVKRVGKKKMINRNKRKL